MRETMTILNALFIFLALACIGLFVYIFQVRRDQQTLDREIEGLNSHGRAFHQH